MAASGRLVHQHPTSPRPQISHRLSTSPPTSCVRCSGRGRRCEICEGGDVIDEAGVRSVTTHQGAPVYQCVSHCVRRDPRNHSGPTGVSLGHCFPLNRKVSPCRYISHQGRGSSDRIHRGNHVLHIVLSFFDAYKVCRFFTNPWIRYNSWLMDRLVLSGSFYRSQVILRRGRDMPLGIRPR